MSWHAFQCTYCGMWRAREIRVHITKAIFVCTYCNKTKKIKFANKLGLALNHIKCDHARHAIDVVRTKNGQKRKTTNNMEKHDKVEGLSSKEELRKI